MGAQNPGFLFLSMFKKIMSFNCQTGQVRKIRVQGLPDYRYSGIFVFLTNTTVFIAGGGTKNHKALDQ